MYIVKYFPKNPTSEFTNRGEGRFIRELVVLRRQNVLTTDQLAVAMGDYIQMLDRLIGIYLTHVHDLSMGAKKIEKGYMEYLNTNPTLI